MKHFRSKQLISLLIVLFFTFACAFSTGAAEKKRPYWVGEYHFQHVAADGSIIDEWTEYNDLADEGEYFLLDAFFRAATDPTGFYIGLVNDTPVQTDALTDLTGEPSGNGYSRASLSRNSTDFPTLALDGASYKITTKQVTFTADGGSIGPVTYAFLATSSDNTGKLIAFVALSTTRTLADGESLNVTFSVTLQGTSS